MKTISWVSLCCSIFLGLCLPSRVYSSSVAATTEESATLSDFQVTSPFSYFSVSFDTNLSKFATYATGENSAFKKILGAYFEQAKDFISVKMMGGEYFKFSAPLEQIVKAKSCDIYGTGNKSTVRCSTPK
jgi:hypothetical protein